MATAEDLLKKAAKRKKAGSKKFTPQRRRAWDGVAKEIPIDDIKKESIDILVKNKSDVVVKTSPFSFSQEGNFNFVLDQLRRSEGIQRRIMEKITAHIRAASLGTNVVDIPVGVLALKIDADKETTRTSIKRLKKKMILEKAEGVRGRKGYTRVIVPDFVAKECLNLFQCSPQALGDMAEIGVVVQPDDKADLGDSRSRSSAVLPQAWNTIDVEPLSDIGFSEAHLKQICERGSNSPEMVQKSIEHFSFGLKHNPDVKKYDNPLKVFMGVLRRGDIWIEARYRSPQEIAQKKFLDAKQSEMERIAKLEKQAYDIAFNEWISSLSQEEVEGLAPKTAGDIRPEKVKLSSHFKLSVWPSMKAEYLVQEER